MSDQFTPPSGNSNVYAPPEARVDDIVAEGEFELADRGTRLGAAILDGLAPAVIGIVAAIAIPSMKNSQSAMILVGTIAAVGIIALIVVNCMWIHQRGQTVGKRIVGIKTVRTDGSRCGLGRVFCLRYLPTAILSAIPFVGYIVGPLDALLIFRDSRKCLHDEIADTIVIKV